MQLLVPWAQASLPLLISVLKGRLRQVSWRRLSPFGITPEQFQALRALQDRPGICHGELAGALALDKPAVTRLLQGLARKGLVQILTRPGHGRRQCLELTGEGSSLLERLRPFQKAIREGLEGDLTGEEQAALRNLLRKLMTNLEALDADARRAIPPEDPHVDR